MTRFTRALAVFATLMASLLVPATSASAASSDTNLLPYAAPNWCGAPRSSDRILVGAQSMNGGTAYVYGSRRCGTNWIEWSGPSYGVDKEIHRSDWTAYTPNEHDYGGWSYSRMVYAPGTTAIDATITIWWGPTAYSYSQWTVHCASVCSWHRWTAT